MYKLEQEANCPDPPHPPPGWVNSDGATLILSVTPVEINWVVIAVFDPFPLSAASHLYSGRVFSTLMSQSIHFMHHATPLQFKNRKEETTAMHWDTPKTAKDKQEEDGRRI